MAQAPKMTPEEWAEVRKVWEADAREGYAWIVSELHLPVSPPAVRKRSMAGYWKKGAGVEKPVPASASKALGGECAKDQRW